MAKNWVDFKKIKADVSMKMVLEHYGLHEGLKESGASLVGHKICFPPIMETGYFFVSGIL